MNVGGYQPSKQFAKMKQFKERNKVKRTNFR